MIESDFKKWANRFPEKGWCDDTLNCTGREIVGIPAQFPCGVCADTFTVIHTHCSVCQRIVRVH